MATSVVLILVILCGLIVPNFAFGYSVSRFDGITVSNINDVLQCDQIECPKGTELCRVVKQSTEENLSKLKRENICYDSNGKVLKEKTWSEVGSGRRQVNLKIEMNSQGRIVTTTKPRGMGQNPGSITPTLNRIFSQVGSLFTNWF